MEMGVKISKQIVGINAASTIFTRIMSMIILIGVQYYLLQRVSPEEFSIYPLLSIFIMFLPLITNIFASCSYRYVTLAYANNERRKITEITSTLVPIVSLAGISVVLLGLVVCYFMDSIFVISPEYLFDARLMLILLVVSSAFDLVLLPYTAAFYALQRLALSNMILLAGELMKAVILAVLLLGISPRVLWVAVAGFVTTILVSSIRTVYSRRMIPELVLEWGAIRRDRMRELIGFGMGVFVVQLSRVLRATAPIIILNRFASPVDVTSYHLGETAYRQAIQSWIPVRKSVSPPLIAMNAKKQHGRLRQAYYRGGRIALWLIMFVCAPLIVFHDEVIYLYAGETYQVAGGVMLMLLLRFPLEMMNAMLPQLSRAKAKVWPLAIVSIGTEIVSILAILLVVWGYGYGALAAAVTALLISLLSELFLMWHVALRLVDGRRMESLRKTLLPGLLPALLAGFVWYGELVYFQPDTWSGLLLATTLGWFVYITAGFFCMLPEDRNDLNSLTAHISRKARKLLSGQRG